MISGCDSDVFIGTMLLVYRLDTGTDGCFLPSLSRSWSPFTFCACATTQLYFCCECLLCKTESPAGMQSSPATRFTCSPLLRRATVMWLTWTHQLGRHALHWCSRHSAPATHLSLWPSWSSSPLADYSHIPRIHNVVQDNVLINPLKRICCICSSLGPVLVTYIANITLWAQTQIKPN